MKISTRAACLVLVLSTQLAASAARAVQPSFLDGPTFLLLDEKSQTLYAAGVADGFNFQALSLAGNAKPSFNSFACFPLNINPQDLARVAVNYLNANPNANVKGLTVSAAMWNAWVKTYPCSK